MNIIEITENSLTLSSGLPQNSFAKTDMEKLLGEKNIILHVKNGSVTHDFYAFSGTKTDINDTALFEGAPFSGEFLADILEKPSYTKSDKISLINFTQGIDYLIKNQSTLGEQNNFMAGAKAVIINTNADSEESDLLFISGNLFERCASNHRKDYSELIGKYIYKGLDYSQSLCFLRGIVSYRVLTGHFPFENEDTSLRQEDIFDENFIPLSLWNPGFNKKLAESIESSLRAKITQNLMAGKKNLTDVKAENQKKKLLEKAENFDSQIFGNELEKLCDEDFKSNTEYLEGKRNDFTRKMNKYLKVKRFLRRNKNRILAILAVALFAAWGADSIVRQNGKLLTTRGMTSIEATQAYYSMIHRMDVPGLQEVIKGRKTKDLFAKISAYYVSSKQRLQVHPDNGTVTPAKWFFFKKASKNWMFGISKLKIDGQSFAADKKYPVRNERPLPLTEENGRILKDGDEVTHTAEYYLIEQAETKIYIQKITDTVTLRYTGKRWRVVQADGKAKVSDIKAKEFAKEFYELTGKTLENDDLLQPVVNESSEGEETSKIRPAIEALRLKYDWIPDEGDMVFAAQSLFDDYGSIEAEKFLK